MIPLKFAFDPVVSSNMGHLIQSLNVGSLESIQKAVFGNIVKGASIVGQINVVSYYYMADICVFCKLVHLDYELVVAFQNG